MKIILELNCEDEDRIVAKSLKRSYKHLKELADPNEDPEETQGILKAYRTIYYEYTGKILK